MEPTSCRNGRKSFFRDRIESFANAFAGAKDILLTEHNAWVHAVITLLVMGLSWWLKIDIVKFIIILVFICLVWIAEAFNTVLELVIDIVSPQFCHEAKRAKDIAAAAVLFASLGALVVGVILLMPPLLVELGF